MSAQSPTIDRETIIPTALPCPTTSSLSAVKTSEIEDSLTDLHEALEATLAKERARTTYQIRPQARTATSVAKYEAENPQQGFRITFTPTGLQVTPGPENRATWSLGLSVSEYGYGERLRPVPPATLVVSENRIAYERGTLTEWYVNEAKGLEQGFTLQTPPEKAEGAVAEPLQVKLVLSGDFTPQLTPDRKAVLFTTPDGETVLSYRDLYVTDAKGLTLPACLSLVDDQLALRVDDTVATYPLTIDPLVEAQQMNAISIGNSNIDFGHSVAMDGDTMVAGALVNSTSDVATVGVATVFVRNGSTWNEPTILTSGSQDPNEFGYSVAISGDTIVVGDTSGMGSVYVFVRNDNGDWDQETVLSGSSQAFADGNFGHAVAIDGDTIVVGEPSSSTGVYVFVRSGTAWNPQTLTTPTPGVNFGHAVAICGDRIAVTTDNNVATTGGTNRVYVFVRSGTTWIEELETWNPEHEYDQRSALPTDPHRRILYLSLLAKAKREHGEHDNLEHTTKTSGKIAFGYSVAISEDLLVVGAPMDGASDGTNAGRYAGSVYVWRRSGSEWVNSGKLLSVGAGVGGFFGYSVAIDGDTIVVGAPHARESNRGSVYLFKRRGLWVEEANLYTDSHLHGQLGTSVAIAGDMIVAGAPNSVPGRIYSYSYKTIDVEALELQVATQSDQLTAQSDQLDYFIRLLGFNQQAKLTASNAAAYDKFGYSVAIDGDTVVVGVPESDENGDRSGSAYVFVRSGHSWNQQDKLIASDAATNDKFGWSVAINGDTIVVGSPHNGDSAPYSGSAYVFVRNGNAWSEQAKLTASDPQAYDNFGHSVAIDGDRIVVAARGEDFDGKYDAGCAYVFKRSGNTWSEDTTGSMTAGKIAAFDATANHRFGQSVAIDGDIIMVGAYWYINGTGCIYVFQLDAQGVWSPTSIQLTASDKRAHSHFGTAIAIDGNTLIVGANRHTVNGVTGVGAAYIFVYDGNTWIEQAKLTASDPAKNDDFGWSVAISGDIAVVGAYRDDEGGNNAGAAYVFVRTGTNWSQLNKLIPDDIASDDHFGYSVGISGNQIVVGSLQDDDHGSNSGSAYIFKRL